MRSRSRKKRSRCSISACSISNRRPRSSRSTGSSRGRSSHLHRGLKYVPEEVKELETSLGDQYICNFSVFQSLLDHWALGQLFPIMPIHRLTTAPGPPGHACRHHLRLRRQDQQVHRSAGRKRHAPAAQNHSRGAVLSRRLPGRRLPGHHGRPAQSLWSRERGARLPR